MNLLRTLTLSATLLPGVLAAQSATDAIRLNQIGFYPQAPKVAVVPGEASGSFTVTTPDGKQTLFTGQLSEVRTNDLSSKQTRLADFSAFTRPGNFVLNVPGLGVSYPFVIAPNVHQKVAIGSIKGFYFQRVSTALPAKYAGAWARPAGHPDTEVLVHSSAASPQRPAGTVISSPRGWYDAGDYNKYIVNSGITMGTLLSLYEDYPAYCQSLQTNIPESGNALPDLLDELLWNLRWMLTMQDPADGGIYHKLTNAKFDGMVMPDACHTPRYVVQKGTAAALDFAAVMAQAARVFAPFARQTPGLADSCRTAAVRAWEWARQHPDVQYRQNELNKAFDPAITTGDYGDRDLRDEWIWAAAELYATTRQDSYYTAVKLFPDEQMPLPSWNQVRLLGYYTLARFGNSATALGKKDLPALKKRLIGFADDLLKGTDRQAYGTVMGRSGQDYIWGSSSVAANQGIVLLLAYRLTRDASYLNGALGNLDYLLGRNATGYSFLTGFGAKSTMHPHHRPSVADGVAAPVPGLLSGGPNGNAPKQDHCAGYPDTTSPDETYNDNDCSYASNEIAINWNAPFVYLAAAVDASLSPAKTSRRSRP